MEDKRVFKKCDKCGHVFFSKCPVCHFTLVWFENGQIGCVNCGYRNEKAKPND